MSANDSLDLPERLARVAAQLFHQASLGAPDREFLDRALPALAAELAFEFLAVVRGEKGRWTPVAAHGPQRSLPLDLLADALDSDSLKEAQGWVAVPLAPRSDSGELLAARPGNRQSLETDLVQSAAGLLHTSLVVTRERHRAARRIDRLEAILNIAGRWNQTLQTDILLEEMAQAATRLLDAERASIFLWDRSNKTLVGRPALGVEGDELRLPDDTGVVGQVVHSGQPRRVDEDEDQGDIDRGVDQQLGFQTRSLLCVPLRGKTGELLGAFELINKIDGHFTPEDETALIELATHAAIALENTQQHEQLVKVRNQMADQAAEGVELIGGCPAIEALRSTIRRVADTDLAVLLLGENGTGKEVASQCIHYLSRRRNEPFVAVNCAALAETLLESELFGHEKGAFTDAHETRPGKFEMASGGTLFLDEIGDMSKGGQAKLLRVLEEKIVMRVGGSTPIHTDARVIAATNQNLADMVRAKRFREDLYYRLNVVTLELPPLRDRSDDIVVLAEHFLHDFCFHAGRRPPKFTAAARKRLLSHSWPGNVRELRNLMERIAYLAPGDKIDVDELAFILSPNREEPALFSEGFSLNEATRLFQRELINKQVARSRGNMTEAAERLGLHRSNLYRKMRQLDMESREE
ncbi:MAG: sigma 54-interacting transcriptional regulator [Pirellulaceae bacterium]